MKKNLLILSILFITQSLTLEAQNLLTNPGFETWTAGNQPITGWTIQNPAGGTTTQDLAHNEGTKSCKMSASGVDTFLEMYQQIPVTPGKTYTLSLSYNINAGDGTDARIWSNFKTSANGKNIALTVEDSMLLKGPGGVTKYFSDVKNTWQTYTCKVIAPVGSAVFRLAIRTYKTGIVSWDSFSFTEDTNPTINQSVSQLNGFNYTPGAGPSTQQSFTISASNLTSGMTISAPANYEISATTGTAFAGTSSLTIAQTNGLISPVTLYVRLKAGLPANTYTGNITLASAGIASQTIALSGSVAAPPATLTATATSLTGFNYISGNGPSAQQSFSVSGSNLTSGITITAPVDYEISALSGASFIGTSSITIAQTAGIVSNTTIYIRLKAGLASGTYTDSVSITTPGAKETISLNGVITSPAGLSTTTNSITNFSYEMGAGPSNIQSFTISGSSLTSYVIVAGPSDFEISTEDGAAFSGTGQILLVPINGTVSNVPVYIRLRSGLNVNTYNENITISSAGTTSKTISLNGLVKLTTATENANKDALKIYNTRNEIVIEGTINKEIVSVYNPMGMLIKSVQSDGGRLTIPVQTGSVYLVHTARNTVKVVL